MKIVVLDGYTLNPGDLTWSKLGKLGDLQVYDRTCYDPNVQDKVINRAKEADILFVNKTPITRDALNQMPNLKYIGVLATGYDVVDVGATKEKGVVVTNIPTYGTTAVAQMTFALLLEMCHHVWEHSEAVKNGEWTDNPDWCFWKYPLIELAGKTMGIIGFGRIGQNVADIAQAFGMKVLAYDTYHNKELENETLKYAELEELLTESDVVSLHCPLFESNKGIINKDTIRKMKKSAMLINTARGPLVVENDLAEALNDGRILGAAIDVVSIEPIRSDNPLLKAKNIIITPHISWAPKESRERLMNIAINNLVEYLDGNPTNVVG